MLASVTTIGSSPAAMAWAQNDMSVAVSVSFEADTGFEPLPLGIEQRDQRDRRLHHRGGKTADAIEVGIGRRVDRVKTVQHGKPLRRRSPRDGPRPADPALSVPCYPPSPLRLACSSVR